MVLDSVQAANIVPLLHMLARLFVVFGELRLLLIGLELREVAQAFLVHGLIFLILALLLLPESLFGLGQVGLSGGHLGLLLEGLLAGLLLLLHVAIFHATRIR